MATKRRSKKPAPQSSNLLDDTSTDEQVDVSVAVDEKRSEGGEQWGLRRCQCCARDFWARWSRKHGPPSLQCCGAAWCSAVLCWTYEEWQARARLALRRPPAPRPGEWADEPPRDRPCPRCERPLRVMVTAPEPHDRALVCMPCGVVASTFTAERSLSDLLDAEALRRCPTALEVAA